MAAGHRPARAACRCNKTYSLAPPRLLAVDRAGTVLPGTRSSHADIALRRPEGVARREGQVVRLRRHRGRRRQPGLRRHGDHGKHRHRGQRPRPDHRPPRQRPGRHRLAGAGDPRALRGDPRRPRDRDLDDHAARPGRRLGVVGRQGALRRRRPADREAAPARAVDAAHDRDDRAHDARAPPGRHAAHLPRRRARAGPRERRDPGRADGAQPDDGGHHRPDAAARDRRAAGLAASTRPACRPGAARTCCSSCRRTRTGSTPRSKRSSGRSGSTFTSSASR